MVSAMSADVHENDMSGPNLLEVSSPDSGVTFSVDNDKFEIETVGSAAVLKLKDGMYLDHEGTGGMVTLMITATDAMDNPSMSTAVTINVGDVNEAPMISVMDSETPDGMTAAASIMENAAGVPVGEIMVSDYDMADQDLSDMITVSDDRFEVSKDNEGGLWLKLKDGVSLDHETDPMVTVTVGVTDTGTNGMAMSASTDVVVSVGNVNEGPTISVVDSMTPDGMPARSNIPENQAGVPVGEIMISDPDMADNMLGEDDLTLSGEHAMYFEVKTDDMGGIWLKLKEGVSLNYEEMSSVMVTVTVTDSGMATAMATVTVTVGNVNEPPSISVDNPMIAENTTGRVGTVTVTDNEEMRDITLDVEDIKVIGAGSPFRVIEDEMGDYVLELTRPIDFESDMVMKDDDFTGTVEVVLEVTDEGGLKDTETIAVVINNVDEAPMISVEDDGDAVSSIAENSNADAEVPVGRIDASDPENGDFDMNGVTLSGADAESFYVKPDDEEVLWLVLKEGVSADHEGDGSLNVTLTVSDGNNAPAKTDFTLTLMDVNEAPMADGSQIMRLVLKDTDEDPKTDPEEVPEAEFLLAWTAGGAAESYKLDITNVFSDEDNLDSFFDYSLKNAPTWLTYNVVRTDKNDVHLTLSGNPPTRDLSSSLTIELVATDQRGLSSEPVMLQIVSDDGNDAVTGIELMGAKDPDFPEVDENESGALIGYLTAVDDDDSDHPHGQHTWKVDNPKLEIDEMNGRTVLKVKDDATIDFEGVNGGVLNVMITATDGGGKDLALPFSIAVNDKNDAPTLENKPGNWWVTVDRGLDPEDVTTDGQWLKFEIEDDPGDTRQLFKDPDAGEKLSYELVGDTPDWLMINDQGVIMSKKGMVPTRGVFDVTVQVKDGGEDGAMPYEETFKLAVVLSDEGDDDNDEPRVTNARGIDIDENPDPNKKDTVVATFTVEDEDYGVAFHPWAPGMPTVTAVNADGGAALGTPAAPFFKVEMVGEAGSESANFRVVLTKAGAMAMDHEMLEDVRLTVTVTDGVDAEEADSRTINFDVKDVNEAPTLISDGGVTASDHSTQLTVASNKVSLGVDQQESEVEYIVLNLTRLFADDSDDPEDLTFDVRVNGNPAWLTIVHQAAPWEDIKDGPNGKDDTDGAEGDDDVDLADYGGTNPVDENDIITVLKIDRTGNNDETGAKLMPRPLEIGQDDDASFSIRAIDDKNKSGTTVVNVNVDRGQNLEPRDDGSMAEGVTLSNPNPIQGATIHMTFNPAVDPDFTGDKKEMPIVEIYEWTKGEATMPSMVSVESPKPYKTTDADVGSVIKGSVVYFELVDGNIVKSNPSDANDADAVTDALTAETKSAVKNRNDPVEGSISFLTTGTNLVATVDLKDVDNEDNAVPEASRSYEWQYSDNGKTGWKTFDANGDTDNTSSTTIPVNPNGLNLTGKYVRLVVTYNDGSTPSNPERVESEPVQVGSISTLTTPPTIDGPSVQGGDRPINGTLRLDGLKGGEGIQWQTSASEDGPWTDIEGETGSSYSVKQADAGKHIRAVVSSKDKGNIVSIVAVDGGDVVEGPAGSNPVVIKAMDDMDVGAAKKGEVFKASTTFDFASLFEDAEGDAMKFDVAVDSLAGWGTDQYDGLRLNVYQGGDNDDTGGNQLLIVDEDTGAVHYYTTMLQNHDGDDDDGAGNTVDLTVSVVGGDAAATAMVKLRIDVEATGVSGSTATGGDKDPFDYALSGGSVAENAKPAVNAQSGAHTTEVAAVELNIIDQNSGSEEYGSYTWGDISDPRFEVHVDRTDDGSMGTLRLKAGQSLDFEALPDNPATPANEAGQLEVFVTATPKSGNFDPIVIKVTYTVTDDQTAADPNQPEAVDHGSNVVPGLKDDGADNTDDDTDDEDDTDGDDDGGSVPMDAMAAFAFSLDGGLF